MKRTRVPLVEYSNVFFHGSPVHTHTHTVPAAPPQNLTGNSLSPTHLRLEWTPPPRDQQNGVIREYQITFTELETGRTWITTTNRLVYEERGLHAYYEYQCSVAAVTVGAGPAQTITIHQPEDGRSNANGFIDNSQSAEKAQSQMINVQFIVMRNTFAAFHFLSLLP